MEQLKGSRRVFLRGAVVGGTAAAGAALPLAALAQQTARPAAPPSTALAADSTPAGYLYLTPVEGAFVETLVEHMAPATKNIPGGMDIGLHTYIDRALGGNWGKGDRLYSQGPFKIGTPNQGYQLALNPSELVRAGILRVNESCTSKYGKNFDQITEQQREETLKALDAGTLSFNDGFQGKTFFDVLYQMINEGLFADPIYGGNKDKAAWKAIGFPGVVAVHAENIVKFKNKSFPAKPLSIADLA
jgi:gluconate 2-dehydrogenase gamma chain